jgi:Cu(I)/Ag(I) efflux system membrane fusion protein
MNMIRGASIAWFAVAFVFFWQPFICVPGFTAHADEGSSAGKPSKALVVSLKNDPDPPQNGSNRVEVFLSFASGEPVPAARLTWKVYMAAMGTMPYMEEIGEVISSPDPKVQSEAARYVIEYWLSMDGSWEVELDIEVDGAQVQRFYSLTTALSGFKDKNNDLEADGASLSTADGSLGQSSTSSADQANNPLLLIGTERLQRIGVRFTSAAHQPLTRDVEAVGILEADDRRRAEIVPRVAGFVESVSVARVGDAVSVGQPLATVYSPELVAAQNEHLIAMRATAGSALAASTREKLRNLGLSESDIRGVEKSGRALREVTLRAPLAGTVLQVSIARGSSFRSGQILYVISDLSATYFVARVFQQDLPLIRVGQIASVTLSGVGETFKGQVDLIYPTVAEGAGTANVRIRMDEKSPVFQPGLYASVTFPVSFGEVLVVPKEAVMHSGKHRYVFVDRGNGRLEPREVLVGRSGSVGLEITAGLVEGDRVVTSGNFLISSEALLRSALPKWGLVELPSVLP